ncbi:MAG TPA: hypothetical protein VGR51_06635 [Thermoplasmata archaeon]|nr:hypothetical protein [Thermoplasmata archaeon]
MTRKRRAALGYALIAIGFGMFMAGPIVLLALGVDSPAIVLPAILGFFVIAAGGILLTTSSEVPRARVASSDGGVRKIGCPNCGASPTAAPGEDGILVCDYCHTRFLMP